MVVQGHVAHERLLQIFGAVEAVGLQDIGNAPVEAFDHAIGSGCPGLGQPVLYAQLLAQLVELMVATGLALTTGKEAIGELLAVVGQHSGDLDRAGLVQGMEEGPSAGGRLVAFDLHEHPARRPVNGHKQVAALGFVLHLRQVLHIHVQVARLVAFERLVRLGRLGGLGGG